jgi:hypothetical protein
MRRAMIILGMSTSLGFQTPIRIRQAREIFKAPIKFRKRLEKPYC